MRTRYGISPWVHEFPESRRPEYPRLTRDRAADVVVIGGGLTGCAIAQACAAAGLDTVLVERDRIGQSSAGRSAGLLTGDPGPAFRDVAGACGLRSARRVFEAWRRGALDAASLLRRLGVKCALEPQDTIVAAGREAEKRLRREYEARAEAGVDASWLAPRALTTAVRIDAAGGMRVRGGYALDPYRACVGLASAARKRGAALFERTAATKTRFLSRHAEVTTPGGVVTAGTIVVATGVAGPEFKPLRRHFTRRERYLVMTAPIAGVVRRQLAGAGALLRDTAEPPHAIRRAPGDRLLVAGADQDETPARTRRAVLVQRTGQLMYELLTTWPAISGLHPEYGWEASYGETTDGLMYIGAHRNYPRHLFALGGTGDSVTGSFVAARLVLRALRGEPDKADAVFGWTR